MASHGFMKQAAILHAEDDECDAYLFRIALSRAGVENPVIQVPDGEAALHYLRNAQSGTEPEAHPFPALLITDLKMPRLSGFDLLAEIQDLLQSRQLRAVVLTASVAEADRERCLRLGADAYFVKPPDLSGLSDLACELKNSWIAAVSQPV
jgi:CheY-like chemotaxis protein